MLHPFALNHSNVGTCWHFFCYGDRRSVAQVAPVCMGSQQCCPRENVCAHVKIVIFFSKKNKQSLCVFFFLDCCKHCVSNRVLWRIWGNIRRFGKKSKNASKCTKRWSDHELEQLIDLRKNLASGTCQINTRRLVLKKTVFLRGRVRWIWVWSTKVDMVCLRSPVWYGV